MDFVKVEFLVGDDRTKDMAIALLEQQGFDGFEERGTSLLAYIPANIYSYDAVEAAALQLQIDYAIESVPEQNWNAVWEANFDPVIVEDFCTIYAHFHQMDIYTPYSIKITPKMSFGTGHHATTQSMIQLMRDIYFKGKSVLDFGTGTGVLAILAAKMGAAIVLGIDNDPWSVENAIENAHSNDVDVVEIQLGSVSNLPGKDYDIVLANINRNVLLDNMSSMCASINIGGFLVMSGILEEDESFLSSAAMALGLIPVRSIYQSGWMAMVLVTKK